ncbi:MAG: hypothetical protein ABUL44_04765 [Flavobacterium sp.]
MEQKNIRVRINLNSREFETEGDQEIIFKNFGELLKEYLEIIKKESKEKPKSQDGENKRIMKEAVVEVKNRDESIPDNFGEYYNRFSKNLSNVDKLLLAGYYVQSTNDSKSFTISEAAQLLLEQGVKLSNANAFNKSNNDTKRIFKLAGKNFRVSDIGIEYIKTINQ